MVKYQCLSGKYPAKLTPRSERLFKTKCEQFPVGSVVYFPDEIRGRYQVSWAIVTGHCFPVIEFQHYGLKDNRRVNGVPVNDVKFPTEECLLPDWFDLYDDGLYKLDRLVFSEDDYPPFIHQLSLKSPNDILYAMEQGYLVPLETITDFYTHIQLNTDSPTWHVERVYITYSPMRERRYGKHFTDICGSWEDAEILVDKFNTCTPITSISKNAFVDYDVDDAINVLRYFQPCDECSEKQIIQKCMALPDIKNLDFDGWDDGVWWKRKDELLWHSLDDPAVTKRVAGLLWRPKPLYEIP